MKYYLVALFDDESCKVLTPVQRNLSKKYRANRNSPAPYIPLEIIDNPNLEKLDLLVDKIIKPYKDFKVKFDCEVFVSEMTKTLNVKIQDQGYIKRLNRLLNDTLHIHGFHLKNISSNLPMYMSVGNLNYISNDMKNLNSQFNLKLKSDIVKVNRIELWKVSNNKRETVIKTYTLKQK